MPKRPDHLRLVDLAEAAEGIVPRLADTTFLVKLGEAAAHVSHELRIWPAPYAVRGSGRQRRHDIGW